MHALIIHELLQKQGQLFDWEIAEATGISIEDVRVAVDKLEAQGDILKCSVTRYIDGQPVNAFQCRLEGYDPRNLPLFGRGIKNRTETSMALNLK